MRTFNDYLVTPEIAGEPLFLREVHAARLMIQDETKGMSQAEWLAYWKQKEEDIVKKYGLENNLDQTTAAL
jgi:hypothetical protein